MKIAVFRWKFLKLLIKLKSIKFKLIKISISWIHILLFNSRVTTVNSSNGNAAECGQQQRRVTIAMGKVKMKK